MSCLPRLERMGALGDPRGRARAWLISGTPIRARPERGVWTLRPLARGSADGRRWLTQNGLMGEDFDTRKAALRAFAAADAISPAPRTDTIRVRMERTSMGRYQVADISLRRTDPGWLIIYADGTTALASTLPHAKRMIASMHDRPGKWYAQTEVAA